MEMLFLVMATNRMAMAIAADQMAMAMFAFAMATNIIFETSAQAVGTCMDCFLVEIHKL